jgi:beta-lactamase regulating signal transducer with metallopeptidase domain
MMPAPWLSLAFAPFDVPMAHAMALALMHFVWQGLAIAAIAMLALHLLQPGHVRLRYAICVAALAVMAICPLVTFLLLSGQAPSVRLSEADAIVLLPGAGFPDRGASGTGLWQAEQYLLMGWFGGVTVLAARLLLGTFGTIRLRRGVSALPPKLAAIAAELGQRAGVPVEKIVFVSREVTEAMALGVVRPLILIPASWLTEMPVAVLEAALAHEIAHLVRRDLWVNWLQRIVETLLFYHPAVWWISGRIRVERELCADALAVALTGKRLEYVQALERVAAVRQADIRPLAAAYMKGEPNMRLLHRIKRLLGQPTSEGSRLWSAGFIALALPVALWAVAAVGTQAQAQDERDEDRRVIKRERDIRERDKEEGNQEQREAATSRRERAEAASQKERVRREEREESSTGDKRGTTETRVERYVLRKDGQEPREVERRTILKDGKPVTVVELGIEDKKLGIEVSDRRIDELTVLVKRLSQQVERLQDEVEVLRGVKPAATKERLNLKDAGERKIIDTRDMRDGERRLKMKEIEEQELRARAEEQRAIAEKKRVLAEQAAKEAAQNKERIRQLDEATRKKIEAALEKAERDQEREIDEAVRKKIEAARAKEADVQERLKKPGKEKETEDDDRDEVRGR